MLNDTYRVTDRLGKNAFDAVYLAEDIRTHTTVVVQELQDDAGASSEQLLQSAERFRAEATRLQQINHPGLARVLDFFSDVHRHYFITEFVTGETLEDRLVSAGALPEPQVLQWAIELCDGLNYLHTQAPTPIIHGDIKPTNIKLMSDGHVKLLGSGIAHALVTESDAAGVEHGITSPYSPLEQYGKPHASDVCSDIYAFGVTLYRLMTNHLPPEATKRLDQPLVPPRGWNPALSEQTETVILKAMAEETGRRYQNVQQLKQALQSITPVAVPVKPTAPNATAVPTPVKPPSKPVGKQNIKLLAVIGSLIAGVLTLTFCGVVWSAIELGRQKQATATAQAKATGTAIAMTTATAIAQGTATANAYTTRTRIALATATAIAQAAATTLARDRATATALAQATMLAQGTVTAQARERATTAAQSQVFLLPNQVSESNRIMVFPSKKVNLYGNANGNQVIAAIEPNSYFYCWNMAKEGLRWKVNLQVLVNTVQLGRNYFVVREYLVSDYANRKIDGKNPTYGQALAIIPILNNPQRIEGYTDSACGQ